MMGDPLGSSRVSSQKQNREGVVGAQCGQYRATVELSPGCGGGPGWECGNNGHKSRTCTDVSGGGYGGPTTENGIMLFGVRVTEGNTFRKSVSMNNLSQYEWPQQVDTNAEAGYASDDVVHASGHRR
ncbi:hypothetical protein TB2_043085 [Malus domestica]